jgi:LacI family transcriptional regulator
MKIEEIANMLGVSKSTVSLAINNKPGVSEATREKVLKTIHDFGYVPRKIVKADATNSTIMFLTCIDTESIIPSHNNISSSFFSELIHGIEKECNTNAFTLSFSTIPLNTFKEQLKKVKEENNFDAAVLLGTNLSSEQVQFAASLLTNLVVIDSLYEFLNVNFVVMNNPMGGYKACSYLISIGHTEIGYVQSNSRITNFDLRKQGFIAAMKENKLVFSNENCFTVGNEIETARHCFKDIILNRKKSLPSALFCESDYIAIGVIKAIEECSLQVPQDISVIGFDDVPESTIISPELSTIHVEKNIMGSLAVKRLISLIHMSNHEPSINQIIDTSLIIRNSIRPFDDSHSNSTVTNNPTQE